MPKINQFTQIQREDIELFHFDLEVEPLLEVLVSKAINEAQIEIIEEDKNENIKIKMDNFKILKRSMSHKLQKLEYKKSRYDKEEKTRKRERKLFNENFKSLHKKLFVRQFIKSSLNTDSLRNKLSLLNNKFCLGITFEQKSMKFIRDDLKNDIENRLKKQNQLKQLFTNIISNAKNNLKKFHSQILYEKQVQIKEKKELQKLNEELLEKERQAKIHQEKIDLIREKYFSEELLLKENLKKIEFKVNLKDSEQIDCSYLWKKSEKNNSKLNHFEIFGVGFVIMNLIPFYLIQENESQNLSLMPKPLSKSNMNSLSFATNPVLAKSLSSKNNQKSNEAIVQNSTSTAKNISYVAILNKIITKWSKLFPIIKLEFPIFPYLNNIFESYKRIIWYYSICNEEFNHTSSIIDMTNDQDSMNNSIMHFYESNPKNISL